MKCPKCAYERLPTDSAPDWQCPSCGVAYAKVLPSKAAPTKTIGAGERDEAKQPASVRAQTGLASASPIRNPGWSGAACSRTLSKSFKPGILCCVTASSPGQALDQQTVAQAFSAENTAAFQQAVVRMYESAHRGMRHELPPGDKPVEFNQVALEFRVVTEEVSQRFGQSVAAQISSKKFAVAPTVPPNQLCAARIFQFEAMLKRPRGPASILIDSVLR